VTHPLEPTQAELDLAASVRDLARERTTLRNYLENARREHMDRAQAQRELAQRFLLSEPPQLSGAATACHRAYQEQLRAKALQDALDVMADLRP
jgi:hypothetical protein